MNKMIQCLVMSIAVILLINGCASIEKEFSESPRGRIMMEMMTRCMELQKEGLLSGIKGGENPTLEFKSSEVDFSDRNTIRYPLSSSCFIVKDGNRHEFPMVKQSAQSAWQLSGTK